MILICCIVIIHAFAKGGKEGRRRGENRFNPSQTDSRSRPVVAVVGHRRLFAMGLQTDRPTGDGGGAGGTRKWARERQQRAVAGRSVRRRRLLLRRRRRTISRRRRECTLILSLFSLLRVREERRTAATTMMIVTRIKLHFSE